MPLRSTASAALARMELKRLGMKPEPLAAIELLILATDHRDQPVRDDERHIADIDLSILGQPEAEYDAYASAIRKEYSHVPDFAYRKGRRSVLRGFLEWTTIFSTREFRDRYESQAHENLNRELAALD